LAHQEREPSGRINVVSEQWTCQHFSLANPVDDGSADLPKLLRRVAEQIETMGIEAMDILDLTITSEITADGPWWSATLYWSPDPA
jgi:hypothetical protein